MLESLLYYHLHLLFRPSIHAFNNADFSIVSVCPSRYVTFTIGNVWNADEPSHNFPIFLECGYILSTLTSSSVALLLKSVSPIVSNCVAPGFFWYTLYELFCGPVHLRCILFVSGFE